MAHQWTGLRHPPLRRRTGMTRESRVPRAARVLERRDCPRKEGLPLEGPLVFELFVDF